LSLFLLLCLVDLGFTFFIALFLLSSFLFMVIFMSFVIFPFSHSLVYLFHFFHFFSSLLFLHFLCPFLPMFIYLTFHIPALLWRLSVGTESLRPDRTFAGSLALGWGIFNLVEGLIDHEFLQIHHVIEAGRHLLWDMLFLGSGFALILAGWAGITTDRAAIPRADD